MLNATQCPIVEKSSIGETSFDKSLIAQVNSRHGRFSNYFQENAKFKHATEAFHRFSSATFNYQPYFPEWLKTMPPVKFLSPIATNFHLPIFRNTITQPVSTEKPEISSSSVISAESIFTPSLKKTISYEWLDIPQTDLKAVLASKHPKIEILVKMAEEYHKLNKSSLELLGCRIKSLNEMAAFIRELAHLEELKEIISTLALLEAAVQGKAEYLALILSIPSYDDIASYHLDFSKLYDNKYQPLPLRNDRTYSLKMKEFWGEFWLESVDPCHRRLAHFYQFWLDSKPASNDYRSFLLWLEMQPISKNIPIVEYYSDEKQESCRLILEDGLLLNSANHQPFNTVPLIRNLYVIDLEGKLYVEPWKEGIWHTSLSRGKPVLGAGLLNIVNGVVTMIAFESGHYLPSIEQSFQTLSIFIDKGVRMNESLNIIYFENRIKYKATITLDALKDFETFNARIHDPSCRKQISANEF